MKKPYQIPAAKKVDYSYEEQVVATSELYNQIGDGHQVGLCTYKSGSFANPCSTMVNSEVTVFTCANTWSLRR